MITKKQLKEYLLMDYPFDKDILNHSVSSSKRNFGYLHNTTIVAGGGYATTNLMTSRNNGGIDFSKDCCIYFEYKFISNGASDWNHIFSFGTHNNDGGDSSYYQVYTNAPRESPSFMQAPSDSNWHSLMLSFTTEASNTTISGYIDDALSKTITVSNLGTILSFYLFGSGCGNEMTAYIRNFKLFQGIKNYLTDGNVPILYSDIRLSK